MAKKGPTKGRRGLYEIPIERGGVQAISRIKAPVATFLGLKSVKFGEVGPNGGELRGAMGTKSYTIYFKKQHKIGTKNVRSVDIPVPGWVLKSQMRKFARGIDLSIGMRTPWGISEFWGEQGFIEGILDDAGNAIRDTIDGVNDSIADAVRGAAGVATDAVADAVGGLGGALIRRITGGNDNSPPPSLPPGN